ncbi:MAG: hypothetical protein Kow0075_10470 [Salibacteraceae bacterium]
MKTRLLLATLTLITVNSFAQLEVHTNNHVRIGPLGAAPSTQLQVTEDIYLQCLPANSGLYIQNHTNQYEPGGGANNTGTNTYQEPSIIGQWGNSAWLGTYSVPFWQVRSFEVWANNVLVSSDSAFKTNVQNMDSATASLMLLRPVTYDHSAGITENTPADRRESIIEAGKGQMGLIAQELFDVYPNLVHDKGNGELAVDYISLIPVLIKAIQEQQAEIEALKAQITQEESQED